MTLNETQIQTVKSFIVKSDIDFVDITFEVLDHMVCDIEKLMEDDATDFDSAFRQTKIKWRSSFKKTDNLWMGLAYVKPKIVIDKCGAIMKKTVLYSVISGLIVTSGIWFLSTLLKFNTAFIVAQMHHMRWVLFFVALSISLYQSWQILKTKVKTVCSYFYMRQFSFLPLYVLFLGFYSSNFVKTDYTSIFLSIAAMSYYYFAFKVYSEHIKYANRYLKMAKL